jgi:hypothetical protein
VGTEKHLKITPAILAKMQQNKVFGVKTNGDPGSSILSQLMRAKADEKQRTRADNEITEIAKSKIMSDLKAMEIFPKKIAPTQTTLVRNEDALSRRVADTPNSTFRQTAEFPITPGTTFSFQVGDPQSKKFESEASIRLNEPMGVDEAVQRASIVNRIKRESFYKEKSRLSVIEETSMLDCSMTQPGPKKAGDRLGQPSPMRERPEEVTLGGLKTKNRGFLEQIHEIADQSRVRGSHREKSTNQENRPQGENRRPQSHKETTEEMAPGRGSLRRSSQEKIKEIARNQPGKVSYAPVARSEHRRDASNSSSFVANITQKYVYNRPGKDEDRDHRPAPEIPKPVVKPIIQNLKGIAKAHLDANPNAASISALFKNKMICATYAEPEKYFDVAIESTNLSSSKEASLKRDSNVSLHPKLLPRKISVDHKNFFRK